MRSILTNHSYIQYIQNVESTGQLNSEGKKIISSINMLAESLSLICVERISLKSRYACAILDDQSSEYTDLSSQSENWVTPPATPKESQKQNTYGSCKSNFIVTNGYTKSSQVLSNRVPKNGSAGGFNTGISKRRKGRRLSKPIVSILSHW